MGINNAKLRSMLRGAGKKAPKTNHGFQAGLGAILEERKKRGVEVEQLELAVANGAAGPDRSLPRPASPGTAQVGGLAMADEVERCLRPAVAESDGFAAPLAAAAPIAAPLSAAAPVFAAPVSPAPVAVASVAGAPIAAPLSAGPVAAAPAAAAPVAAASVAAAPVVAVAAAPSHLRVCRTCGGGRIRKPASCSRCHHYGHSECLGLKDEICSNCRRSDGPRSRWWR